MKYNNPEIKVLGDAASVIQGTKFSADIDPADNGRLTLVPSYDLDE